MFIFFEIAAGVRAYDGRFCRARSIVRLHFWHAQPTGKKKNFGRWITDEPDDGSMNSIQNGILLQSTCHQLFDLFRFSINPMYVVIRYLSTTQLLIVGLGRPQNCLLSRLSIWSFRKMP